MRLVALRLAEAGERLALGVEAGGGVELSGRLERFPAFTGLWLRLEPCRDSEAAILARLDARATTECKEEAQ